MTKKLHGARTALNAPLRCQEGKACGDGQGMLLSRPQLEVGAVTSQSNSLWASALCASCVCRLYSSDIEVTPFQKNHWVLWTACVVHGIWYFLIHPGPGPDRLPIWPRLPHGPIAARLVGPAPDVFSGAPV